MARGFTLLELIIVIVVIMILAAIIILISLNGAAEAKDAKRVQELHQVAEALQFYQLAQGKYPDNTDTNDPGCDIHGITWDAGNGSLVDDTFMQPLLDERLLNVLPKEMRDIQDAWGSACLYRYARVTNPCDGQCQGTYAILYAACETKSCPTGERPSCCNGSSWGEGTGDNDIRDIVIFLKQKN